MGNSSSRTPEHHAIQAKLIHTTKPRLKSTGLRIVKAKAVSARNADKPNSLRRQLQAIVGEIRRVRRELKEILIRRYGRRRYYL